MFNVSLRAQVSSLLLLFGALFAGFIALVWRSTAERVEDSVYTRVLQTKDVVADVMPPPLYAVEAWLVAHQAVLADDPSVLPALERRWGELETAFDERERHWTEHLPEGALRSTLEDDSLPPAKQLFATGRSQLFPLVKKGQRTEAEALLHGQLAQHFKAHQHAIDRAVRLAAEVEAAQRSAAAAEVRQLKWTLLAAGVIGLLVALALGWRIAGHLTRRLEGLVSSLEAAANGDLSPRPADRARDEVTRVHDALRATLSGMASAIESVQRVSRQVEAESTALATTSGSLKEGVSTQAASSAQTSASLEELTANAQQTADIAQRANALSEKSRGAVDSTNEVMQSAQRAMTELAASSTRVRDIVGTVDEMAFQTNLLALNAAVEAARAGEAGRGFAVVAHEVRELAQRSAAAAKQIRSLIQGSAEQVASSAELVNACSSSLATAGEAVGEVSSLMARLATAAKEQSAGVEEINRASIQRDAIAQTTAGQASKLTDAAARLSSSATNLTALAQRFKTGGQSAAEPALLDFETGSGNERGALSPAHGTRTDGAGRAGDWEHTGHRPPHGAHARA
ncbi:MAG: methyl-accepting chemotaxis protein [Myxococcaceae bacterium]|jgi:methyl-accepting chemotaxis protein|nr:methyl-accepting chemotaxis protein [Myxococcaceae bacterium]